MDKKGTLKLSLFIIFLGVFVFGGFVLMKKSEGFNFNLDVLVKENTPQKTDIRLDKQKDYIYFENEFVEADDLDIKYSDIKLNFTDYNNIVDGLNKETQEFKNSVRKDENNSEYEGLVYARYKNYEVYSYEDYISLVINYFTFTTEDIITYEKTVSYIFDKITGRVISEDSILKKFKLDKDDVQTKIKEYVEDQDLLTDANLNVVETLNNLKVYPLFIDRLGNLKVSILVKNDMKDYNGVITLN